jgi:hypothetical protein
VRWYLSCWRWPFLASLGFAGDSDSWTTRHENSQAVVIERSYTMYQKNMGQLDRAVRFIIGVALVLSVLFVLDGTLEIVAAAFALLLILTSVTGFCPGYIPFGISTLKREEA